MEQRHGAKRTYNNPGSLFRMHCFRHFIHSIKCGIYSFSFRMTAVKFVELLLLIR